MEKVYIYYESKTSKDNETTSELIEVFKTSKKAKLFMNERRKELINKYGLITHPIDGCGDKNWTRLYLSEQKDNYIDLITEEKLLI